MADPSREPHPGDAAAQQEDERDQHDEQAPGAVTQAAATKSAAAAAAPPAPGSSPARSVAGPVAALAAAGAAAALLLRYLLRRRKKGGERVRLPTVAPDQVFTSVAALEPPAAAAAGPLHGRTLVLSECLDVAGLETRFGCTPWTAGRRAAAATFAPAQSLVGAGARGRGTVLSEPLGLGPLLSLEGGGTPNPAGRGRTHGGGEYGAAVAVAAGFADVALAVDGLGTARVPAACCGVYALRATAGALALEGASTASHSLAAPALLASDPLALLKAGAALRLPGGGAPTTDVLSYLVAEDFFAACGQQARDMVPAVVAAVKRWAGPDQAQALSLCEWLYHRVESLAAFMPPPPDAAAAVAAAGVLQPRAEGVLAALAAAAQALRAWEFASKYGAWAEAHRAQLPPAVAAFLEDARQVDEGRYRAARAVAGELQAAMRDALRDGYVFVLPTTPGPAPPSDADPAAAAAFAERCAQFASVAALSGVPQAVLPLPLPGGMPLSISLLAQHRRDQVLLQAAAKLGPMLAEEAATLAAQQRRDRRGGKGGEQAWRPQAAAAAEPGGAGAGAGPAAKGGSKRGKAGDGSAAAAAEAAAEACKEEGNAAFRAGRYEEAVRQYSAAIQYSPRSAVYYANRAMASLKLGAYGAAEADCDEALKLELSVKALLRRASARLAQGNAEGGAADFRQVLALEPHNRQAREELRGIEALGAPTDLQAGAWG